MNYILPLQPKPLANCDNLWKTLCFFSYHFTYNTTDLWQCT